MSDHEKFWKYVDYYGPMSFFPVVHYKKLMLLKVGIFAEILNDTIKIAKYNHI